MHESVVFTGHALKVREGVRRRALAYPEAVEVEQFGHPWFKAGKRPFAIVGQEDGQPQVSFAASLEDQQTLCAMDPSVFVPTPYMHQHGWTTMRVRDPPDWETLEQLLDDAYRRVALKRMVKALEARA